MTEKNISEFSEILSAGVPVPGGGGAAALVGSLSSALALMVLNYSTGKKKFAQKEDKIQSLLARIEEIRKEFLNLIEEDAKAFEPLSKAYSISKDDPNRGDLMEAATMSALQPPFRMLKLSAELSPLIKEVYELNNVILNSDVACAASLCTALSECAIVNVFVNTSVLIDRDYAKSVNTEAANLMTTTLDLTTPVYQDYLNRVAKQ